LNANKQKSGPNFIIYILAIIGIGLIIYFGGDLIKNIGNLRGKSALSVISNNQEADVYLNKTLLGKTPYENKDLKAGENKVILKTSDRQYETEINFTPKSQVVVNRDLGISDIYSSGQNFWMEESNSQTVLSVTSEPSTASVFIDNTEIGKTPFSSTTLTAGEYDIRVEQAGYENQISRIKIQSGLNLNVSVKLFPVPVPTKATAFEGSAGLFDLSTANATLSSDTENWAKALVYWNKTRGVSVADLGVNKEQVFDYFLDYKGALFTKDGVLVADTADLSKFKDATKGGYLGRTSDGTGLTQEAKDTFTKLTAAGVGGKTAKILDTGLGWLRVRDAASLDGLEIGRAIVGESYPILEEQPEWVKIKLSDTIQGWVSKTYVQVS
jgi:hypothetical protein